MEAAKAAEKDEHDNQGPTPAEQARSLFMSGIGEEIKPEDESVKRSSPPNSNLIQLKNESNEKNELLK